MIKILHIVSGLGSGGVESMLYNYYANIDKTSFKFDFIVHDPNEGVLEETFVSLGSKVFHVTPKKVSIKKNITEIYQIIKDGDYDIIHSHQNEISFIPLILAKMNGIKVRIAHSHVGNTEENFLKKIKLIPFKLLTRFYSTNWFACSKSASQWLFGNEKKTKSVDIINNAIDTNRFIFNEETRKKTRVEYDWEEKIVIGNVARFYPEKNHELLISIFNEIHERCPSSILVLIGGEGNENEIRGLVKTFNLTENVIFLGIRTDVDKFMQAMDIFILPSKYEGLGMVLVEAQATNLKCFASDKIPKETAITDDIEFISLGQPPEYWAERVLNTEFNYSRNKNIELIREKGFDIQVETKKLMEIYRRLVTPPNID